MAKYFLIIGLGLALLISGFVGASMQASSRILAVDWSPDGTQIATGDNAGVVRIWVASTGTLTASFQGHLGDVFSVRWNPSGNQIVSGGSDGSVRIWDVATSRALRVIQDVADTAIGRSILDVEWSPSGDYIVGAREAGLVTVWDANSGEIVATFRHEGMAVSVDWHPLGNLVASGGLDGNVLVWSLIDASVSSFSDEVSPQLAGIHSIAWSPDGNRIAIASVRSIQVFDYLTGTRILEIPVPPNQIDALHWNPNGVDLAVASNNDQIAIIDSTTGATVNTINGVGVFEKMDWSPYGAMLIFEHAGYEYSAQFADDLQIVVPDPSLERLQSIAALCDAPLTVTDAIPQVEQPDALTDFVAQVTALPEGAIPPACAADLIAVAEAISAGQ